MADTRQPKTLQSSMIAGGIIVMLAVSGYFVGLRQTNSAISMTRPVENVRPEARRDLTGATNVPVAVRYIDQDWSAKGVNAMWRNSLVDFQQVPVPPPDAKRVMPPEQKQAALRDRAARRAYDGAPPVVPHPVTQDSSASCLACHGQGMQVKDRFASKMSHASLGGSCTQCHVSTQHAFTAVEAARWTAPLTENTFHGKEAPAAGTRAWKGAPPTVPHRTLMRSDCMSCHGPSGLFALRTPHPERQSCVQCHVPAAENDQRLFVSAPPLDAARPAAPKPVVAPAPVVVPPAPIAAPPPK
ncbi:hypothetical protein [Prosthecobacter sp.]|uniref:hypothetical protein n=1 Tax=Prosthecobacter sp. TaxID=1965333 RepID=UPI002ABB654B|nr:hypothetical protein [Prosthecobacter sp.]MDZ4402517.1 hypothetical protein [Prosthecobacter sp.]